MRNSFLYFIDSVKIKEISNIMGLRVSNVYSIIKMVKIKFSAAATRKLPVLFRSYKVS